MAPAADPFSADAFRRFTGTLRFGKHSAAVDMKVSDNLELATTLCATVGTGKAQAKPGAAVVVVLQCAVSAQPGDGPLFASRAGVDVAVENGTVETVSVGDRFREDDFKDDRYDLSALGIDKKGRPEVATLTLVVRVADAPTGRQMRCRFTFVALTPPGSVTEPQTIRFAQPERVVEVQILPPS